MDPHRRVTEAMQREVVTLETGDHLDLADDIMKLGRIRHMPVIEDGRLVGVVSNRDLLAASLSKVLDFDPEARRSFMRSVAVSEVMSADPLRVGRDATLREAAEIMIREKIGCLPVVDEGGVLLGLLSETDLLREALLADEPHARKLEEENRMAELGEKFSEEIEALKRARDELRLKVHLAKADAKDLWDSLEQKWEDLEARAKHVQREVEQPVQDVGAAAKELAKEIREGYRRIRDAL